MVEAKKGDTVKVHYTGKLKDGTVFDSSRERDPLAFTVGEGQVIPGFENAVVGMSPGDSKTEEIPVDDAYGPQRPELMLEVPKTNFPEDLKPEVGQQLAVASADGRQFPAVVADVKDETVVLDANHPLAGKELVFEIELVGLGDNES